MKTIAVILTDEEADHIEATARERGISAADVLHDAVSAYLREVSRREPETPRQAKSDERSDLGFIGLFSGNESTSYAPEEDPAERERVARLIWEDSFGGTRPWPEPDGPSVAGNVADDTDLTN
jgi:hypothetical protein